MRPVVRLARCVLLAPMLLASAWLVGPTSVARAEPTCIELPRKVGVYSRPSKKLRHRVGRTTGAVTVYLAGQVAPTGWTAVRITPPEIAMEVIAYVRAGDTAPAVCPLHLAQLADGSEPLRFADRRDAGWMWPHPAEAKGSRRSKKSIRVSEGNLHPCYRVPVKEHLTLELCAAPPAAGLDRP